MSEEWRPIKGYEAHYAVSDLGRVKSFDRLSRGPRGTTRRIKGRILVLNPLENRYLQVILCVDSKRSYRYVHRLVAEAFLGSPAYPDAPVNHLDFDGLNNVVSNLEWSDPKANIQHSHRARHFCPVSNKNFQYKLTPDDVLAIRARYASGESPKSLAAHFNVHYGHIGAIVSRRKWVNL